MTDDYILAHKKQRAIKKIDQFHADLLNDMTGEASAQERETWSVKGAAAYAYINGTAEPSDVILIETEASFLGITGAQFAEAIQAKSQAFKLIIAVASGVRAQGKAAINACNSVEDIEAIMPIIWAGAEGARINLVAQLQALAAS